MRCSLCRLIWSNCGWERGLGDGLPHPLPFPLLVRLRFLVFAFVFDSVGATVSIGQVGQSCLSRRGNTLCHSQVNAIWEYECVSISMSVCVCLSSHTFRCCGMWNDDKSFARKTRELSWGLERQSRKEKSSPAGRAKQKDRGCCRDRPSVGWGWGCWVLGDRLQSLLLAHLTKTLQAKWRMRVPNAECEYKWESDGIEWIWIVNGECRLRMWMRMRMWMGMWMRMRMCMKLSSYSIP